VHGRVTPRLPEQATGRTSALQSMFSKYLFIASMRRIWLTKSQSEEKLKALDLAGSFLKDVRRVGPYFVKTQVFKFAWKTDKAERLSETRGDLNHSQGRECLRVVVSGLHGYPLNARLEKDLSSLTL
jgi:hypothetical protein